MACARSTPGRARKRIERKFEIASTIVLGLGKTPATDVHLQGMQDQLRHRKRPVAGLTQRNELRLALADQMRVQALLFADRALPARLSAARLIIVAGKDPGLIGKSGCRRENRRAPCRYPA